MSGETPHDAYTVVTEADLAEPPETVWRALTTPEILSEWLGPNDLPAAALVGTRFGVDAPAEPGGRVGCEILELVPNERLSCTWTTADPDAPQPLDTVVVFELAPIPSGGTRLRILHRGAVAEARDRTTMRLGTRRGCGRRWPIRVSLAVRPGSSRAVGISPRCPRRLAA